MEEKQYMCEECGYIFTEPKIYYEDLTPGFGFDGGSFIYKNEGCPKCEGSYVEMKRCEICGYFVDPTELNSVLTKDYDLEFYCNDCYDEEGECENE